MTFQEHGDFTPASTGGGGGPTHHYFVFNMPGTLTVSTGVARLYVPPEAAGGSIVGCYGGVNTAPTGAAFIADVLKNGTTIYTGGANRPQIPISGFQTQVMVTPAVATIAANDYFTVNIAQIGSTVAGADLVLVLVLQW